MSLRGAVHTKHRAGQLRDYSGLLLDRKITPSDIDGVIEYGDNIWVFIELKIEGVEMPYGQRLMYERLVDDLAVTGKPTMCLVAEHNTSVEEQINAALCSVSEFRYRGKWHKPIRNINLREAIDKFLDSEAK